VIDTASNKVIASIPIGQAPQAVVYVPNAVQSGASGAEGLQPLRISRKEGHRFTTSRSMVSRHVGPLLVKQDVLDFPSMTIIRQ
jgi:hypothetical protein